MSDPTPAAAEFLQEQPAILVVEDDPHFSELMGRILSPRHGFTQVSITRSMSQALACLETQAFGLIFLDLNLPDSKGMATLSRILPRSREAQILVMTGEVDDEKALQAMREGAHDYLVKGHLSPDALRRVARYALERYAAGRELRQYRSLLSGSMDALPACIAILDSADRVQITNSRWRTYADPGNPLIHGCSEGVDYTEAVQRFWGVVDPEITDPTEVKGLLQVLAGQRERFVLDYSVPLEAGIAWYALSMVRFTESGHTHVLIAHIDITERKELEVQLKASEDLFTLITQNVVDLMAIIEATGHRVYTSPSYLRQLGYDQAEMGTFSSLELLHPEDRTSFKTSLERLFAEGRMADGYYRLRRKDGQYRDYEANGVVIRDDPGKPPRALLVARDITERRTAELERQQMEVLLRHSQKLEAIGQLAAGIAHEINTPTQYIGDNAIFLRDAFKDVLEFLALVQERIRQGDLPEEWKERVQTLDLDYLQEEIPRAIQQSLDGVDRVSRIVSAMKDFSHPGGAVRERVDLNRAIESTITVSRNAWKYVATLETDFDPQLPLVPCFASEFNQVILNLLVNSAHAIEAANASKPPGGMGLIRVSTRQVGDMVEVRISDSGTGIPKEIQSRIFEPFFTTKPVGKGTGQGLSIAHGVIVDKHHGRIDLQSTPGEGTTFILQLPLQASDTGGTA